MTEPAASDVATIVRHLNRRLRQGERCLVGITGPPGVGKSTFADTLADRFDPRPPIVGMDGFHLANSHLDELGLIHRKGAHYTFDEWGYVATLARIAKQDEDEIVYVPEFDRGIEDSIAASVAVKPSDRLVLTEGNYLLLDRPPWHRVRDLLSLSIYVEADETTRLDRLIRRHVDFGKTEELARQHVHESDQVNAHLIAGSRHHADFVVRNSR